SFFFFFSSRRRHTRFSRDWSSDVCSSDLSNIQQRMLSHNHLGKKGWTVRFRPWVIVHTEEFQDKQLALKREKQLKTAKGREFIREIIAAGSYPPDGGQQIESGPRY